VAYLVWNTSVVMSKVGLSHTSYKPQAGFPGATQKEVILSAIISWRSNFYYGRPCTSKYLEIRDRTTN
jgi:hypothetical protein